MKIVINGKNYDFTKKNMLELCNSLNFNKTNTVVIINGFQTSENLQLCENDQITLIKKGEMPNKDELERLICARHTPLVFEKVKKARVAIAGLGGLGSNIAISLARTGVGTLHLIDFDIVEPSNLNRQQYRIKHLGLAKTEALKTEILEINPYIEVITDNVFVSDENIDSLFKNDEIICEAFDNPASKALLVNVLLEQHPEKIVIAASGMAGYESSNTIITKKISDNFYICGDFKTEARQGCGLMAPRVGICANHQANMILRLIIGETEV